MWAFIIVGSSNERVEGGRQFSLLSLPVALKKWLDC